MLDGQIVAALIAEIKTQLEIYGIDPAELRVARAYQVTSQHAGASRFEAFIAPVTNTDIGWRRGYDNSDIKLTHTKQKTYQVSAMTQFDPSNPGDIPAQDLAHIIHDMMQQPDSIRTLRDKCVYIQRCGPVRPSFWVNDSDEFESMPNFDVVVSYNSEYIKPVPVVTEVTGDTERV